VVVEWVGSGTDNEPAAFWPANPKSGPCGSVRPGLRKSVRKGTGCVGGAGTWVLMRWWVGFKSAGRAAFALQIRKPSGVCSFSVGDAQIRACEMHGVRREGPMSFLRWWVYVIVQGELVDRKD